MVSSIMNMQSVHELVVSKKGTCGRDQTISLVVT
jgi:hypothetical protein